MTSIAPREVEYAVVDDPSCAGAAHGVNAPGSITLDVSKFTKSTHCPNGVIPSGTAVAKIAASGKYGPAGEDATDDVVFTFGSRRVADGAASILVAGLDHGRVVESRLPVPVDAAVKTAIGSRIQFVYEEITMAENILGLVSPSDLTAFVLEALMTVLII